MVSYGFQVRSVFLTLVEKRAGVVPRQRLQDGTLANKGMAKKAQKAIMALGFLDIFRRFWDF